MKSYSQINSERGRPGQGRTATAPRSNNRRSAYSRTWSSSPSAPKKPSSSSRNTSYSPNTNTRTTYGQSSRFGHPVAQTKQRNWGPFSIPNGTLPYAYQPTADMFMPQTGLLNRKFKVPTIKEVLKDLGWILLEGLLACAGRIVFEFFSGHRRFYPGPGKV